MDQYYLFVFLAPAAAIITTVAALYAWQRRLIPGAIILMLDLLCVTGWLLSSSFELLSRNPQAVIISAKMTYLFISVAPVLWIGFAFQYTGKEHWLSFPRFLLFWIIPSLTFMFAQTNELHGLIWVDWRVISVNKDLYFLNVPSYGSWFWVHVFYSYILIFLGAFLIGRQYFNAAEIYRQQSRWLIAGVIVPLTFNFAYILRLIPNLQKDFSSLAYAFAGIAFSIGIFRHGLLDIMPIARNMILENMQEGMFVVDQEGRLLDVNPIAQELLLSNKDNIIGVMLEEYLPEIKPLLQKKEQSSRLIEFTLERNGSEKNFEAKMSGLRSKNGKCLGYLIVVLDITERKRLYQEVAILASKDSLTGLNNRRHLLELAQQELDRSYRYQHPVSLLLIDVDNFKNINDSYGHLTGDLVMTVFSDFLKKTLRSVDIIGRFGGDEFMVVLPETSLETALKTGERLCSLIQNEACQTDAGNVKITISVGVSGENTVKKGADIYMLIDQADRALYQAKSLGRNQVTVEDDITKI